MYKDNWPLLDILHQKAGKIFKRPTTPRPAAQPIHKQTSGTPGGWEGGAAGGRDEKEVHSSHSNFCIMPLFTHFTARINTSEPNPEPQTFSNLRGNWTHWSWCLAFWELWCWPSPLLEGKRSRGEEEPVRRPGDGAPGGGDEHKRWPGSWISESGIRTGCVGELFSATSEQKDAYNTETQYHFSLFDCFGPQDN